MAFIVFEGIDGSGISTQSYLLKQYLGENTLLTKEPSDGIVGMLIRTALKGKIEFDDLTMALLFVADRTDHNKDIKQIQQTKKIENIVCDRYYLSNYAYQSTNIDLGFLKKINSMVIHPDLTIFIDVPVDVCMDRIKRNRFHIELYENLEMLNKVRSNFLSLIKEQKRNIVVVDGNKKIEQVRMDVIEVYEKRFRK